MSPEIEKLLNLIEKKLDWGESLTWQNRDFENLNQLILDETGVSLSASTLRRIWGKVEYKHLPSTTTLDTLAKFAGFESWRFFLKQNTAEKIEVTAPSQSTIKPAKNRRQWNKITGLIALIIIIIIVGIFASKKSKPEINPRKYSFSSRAITKQIPNSVIFTYDASASPTDSVYIQQSWDSRTKKLVDKNLHQHTSVYYEPGFYRAKLFIDTQVVKEHPLLIPTDGWLGLISNNMIPVYLQPGDFIFKDSLQLSADKIENKNIPMEPMPPIVKYYNVGNFEPVSVKNFSFSADIKNEYNQGAAACQFTGILIVTDDAPLYIPLSIPGCVSDLSLRSIDEVVSGKKADLSGFGVDFSNWVHVSCKAVSGKSQFIINDKKVYECMLPDKEVKIVGLLIMFQGTGAVKNIQLSDAGKTVFSAFDR